MASSPRFQHQLRETLRYFDKYDYPLTAEELHIWSGVPKSHISKNKEGYYFLPGRKSIIGIRKSREKHSLSKWVIAKQVGERLKLFPTIAAVFVTGALAMNNCPADDDIDLMIITYPHTLWLTRLFVNLLLYNRRRRPLQRKAPNKVCLNLWLDLNNLDINPQDLYRAHEILQAKKLWDRGGVEYKFLKTNSWAVKYLPTAYKNRKLSYEKLKHRSYWFLACLNIVAFIIQYLHMKPRITTEKVGLGFAFFHPVSK